MAIKKHVYTPDQRRLVAFRLSEDVIEWIARIATREGRSRNQMVEFMFRGAMMFDNIAHTKAMEPLLAGVQDSAERLVKGAFSGVEKSGEVKTFVQRLVSEGRRTRGK